MAVSPVDTNNFFVFLLLICNFNWKNILDTTASVWTPNYSEAPRYELVQILARRDKFRL